MRKLITFNMMTLDGYFQGPGQDISWHHTDEEFQEFAITQLQEIGAIVFGRITYEMMSTYWPSAEAVQSDPVVAGLMNDAKKYVFSRTMQSAEWSNTTLLGADAIAEMRQLKAEDGKDIFIFGSSKLAVSMIDAGLVDEFRTMINPVLLGDGDALYKGIKSKLELEVTGTRPFGNGNILHISQPLSDTKPLLQ